MGLTPISSEGKSRNKYKSWASGCEDEKEFAIKRLKCLPGHGRGVIPAREPVLQVTSLKKNLSEGQRTKMSVQKFFRAGAFERAFRKRAGRCLPRLASVVVCLGNTLGDVKGSATTLAFQPVLCEEQIYWQTKLDFHQFKKTPNPSGACARLSA